jgi:hypothetical protein
VIDRFWGMAIRVVIPLAVLVNELNHHLRKKWSHR